MSQPEAPERRVWTKPAIEWENRYEPVVFTVSCARLPYNCGAAGRGAGGGG